LAAPAQLKLTAIYALSDSDGVIRYVGKANDPRVRFLQHRAKRKTGRTPLYAWMRDATDVTWSVLEWVHADAWEEAECRHIAEYRKSGLLLNVAKGGNQPSAPSGAYAQRVWEIKKKFARLWRTMPEESKDRLRARWMPAFKRWAQESPEIASHLKGLGYLI
jgi:predicted GIY-YIG superfamily endonuclease